MRPRLMFSSTALMLLLAARTERVGLLASSPGRECPPSASLLCSDAHCAPPRQLQLQCGDRLYAGAPVRGLVALVMGTLQNFEPVLDWSRQVPLRFHAGADLLDKPTVSVQLLLSPDKCPPGVKAKPDKLSACLDPSPKGDRTLRADAAGNYQWPDDLGDGTYYLLACATFRYLDTLETVDCFEYSIRLTAAR